MNERAGSRTVTYGDYTFLLQQRVVGLPCMALRSTRKNFKRYGWLLQGFQIIRTSQISLLCSSVTQATKSSPDSRERKWDPTFSWEEQWKIMATCNGLQDALLLQTIYIPYQVQNTLIFFPPNPQSYLIMASVWSVNTYYLNQFQMWMKFFGCNFSGVAFPCSSFPFEALWIRDKFICCSFPPIHQTLHIYWQKLKTSNRHSQSQSDKQGGM